MIEKCGHGDIRKTKRKVFRIILGPKLKDVNKKLGPNDKLYQRTEGVV